MSKLQEELMKVLAKIGINEQTMLPVMQRLGEVQAKLDSIDDEQNVTYIQELLRQVQDQIGSLQWNGPEDSSIGQALSQLQSKVASFNLDEQAIANALKGISSLHDQAGTMLQEQLAALKLNEKEILDLLQKFRKSE